MFSEISVYLGQESLKELGKCHVETKHTWSNLQKGTFYYVYFPGKFLIFFRIAKASNFTQ